MIPPRPFTAFAMLVLTMSARPTGVSNQPRLTERTLSDIAVISVPRSLTPDQKGETKNAPWDEDMGKLSFGFSNTYFWASMGSVTAYKERLIVSVMAPDATASEYAESPRRMSISYEQRRKVRSTAIGSGSLTVYEGIYTRGSETEPALQFVYSDRARRLQIVWHAVKQEVDLETGVTQIGRIAASFKIVKDPLTKFASMRDAPRQEAESRTSKRATVLAMLRREGYTTLEPGMPILRNGVYLEWMSDPEPRYQLLVPLGRMRGPANGSVVNRPRPLAAASRLAGSVGWREMQDGEWVFTNQDNAYLPLPGIAAQLSTQQKEDGYVYFFYVGTVRVEEVSDDRLLTSLRWFLDDVPEVQRRWRDGTLVGPGRPEAE